VNLILAIPFGLRLAGLFVIGVCGGALVNLAVYRLAWRPRSISPWSPPLPEAPTRRTRDRAPIFGWVGLRREASLHGLGFWVRPMLVEILCGIGFAALYWWEIGRLGLVPAGVLQPLAAGPMAALHAQYACHVFLITLMIAGSLIDIDEKTIPDSITMPGTLIGLVAAAVFPWSLLPTQIAGPAGNLRISFVHLVSPQPWPAALGGFPQPWPLLLGLGCWWLWCVALMPRTWYPRHGRLRAVALCLARLGREALTWQIAALGLIGSAGIASVWWRGGPCWQGFLSALVGMAASGGLVWAVRIIGTSTLGREAMGFGDVTLMAMIGAFLGWQACVLVFFLAPLAGAVVGLLGLILRRGPEIPYGPFLCLATLVVIVRWAALWEWARPIFALGVFVPLVIIVCLALMAILLGLWRLILTAFR